MLSCSNSPVDQSRWRVDSHAGARERFHEERHVNMTLKEVKGLKSRSAAQYDRSRGRDRDKAAEVLLV